MDLRMVGRSAGALAVAVVVVGLGSPASAAGQGSEGVVAPPAAPYLAPDHWALTALRRADAAGLVDGGFQPAMPGVHRIEASRLLEQALEAGRSEDSPLVAQLEGYVERFAEEFPGAAIERAAAEEGGWRFGGKRAYGGYFSRDAEMLTGVGTPEYGYVELAVMGPAEDGVAAGVDVSGYAGARFAVQAGIELEGDEVRLADTYGMLVLGPVDVWGGRRALRLGYGTSGLILTGSTPLDGAGVAVGPFRLPWLLDHLGPVSVSTFVGRLERVAPHDGPWLWLFRATMQPHPRFDIGVNRGAMVVGVDGAFRDRLRQVGYVLIGKHGEGTENQLENQIASVNFRWRPPAGPLPLRLYLEWGFDDSAGSWRDVPGIIGGAYLGAVPGLPWLGAGVERSHFAPRCCGNIWWYQHTGLQGGWTEERRPLGHPLGGHGDEWAGTADLTLAGSDVVAGIRVYWRDRGDENLFAPTFTGESTGGAVDVSARLIPSAELELRVEHEAGTDDWSRTVWLVGLRLLF